MNALGLACLFLFILLLSSYVLLRFHRSRSAVPIPSFLTTLIDHPLRRRFVQPPEETSKRHGIQHIAEVTQRERVRRDQAQKDLKFWKYLCGADP
jgi:hypothetical protein